MKICTVCGAAKPTSEFYKSKINADGFCPLCKSCNSEGCRKYRLANKERLAVQRAQHYIDNKERLSAEKRQYRLDNLELARQRGRAYSLENVDAIRARQKKYREKNKASFALRNAKYGREHKKEAAAYQLAYRAENRERLAARMAAWQKRNPLKTRAANATRRSRIIAADGAHTAEDIRSILSSQKNKCACCKVKLVGKKYDVDHKMPLKLGGSNDPLNLQILCQSCNRSKGARHPVDFMRARGFLL